jgi:hypothetical protein
MRRSIAKSCLQLLHRGIILLRCGFTPVYALLGRFLPRLKAASGRPPFLAMTVRVRPTATRGPPFLIFRSCLCTSWVSRGECRRPRSAYVAFWAAAQPLKVSNSGVGSRPSISVRTKLPSVKSPSATARKALALVYSG